MVAEKVVRFQEHGEGRAQRVFQRVGAVVQGRGRPGLHRQQSHLSPRKGRGAEGANVRHGVSQTSVELTQAWEAGGGGPRGRPHSGTSHHLREG